MSNNYDFTLSIRLMTYNHANFIQECMDSIFKQKVNFMVEVVVGDDFSTDGTLEIVKRYKDTDKIKIKILDRKKGDDYWHKRNQFGRLYNFFNILENCSGKYIALLDGDDYWTDPLKLQKQVDFLEVNDEYVLTGHDAIEIDKSGKVVSLSKLSTNFKKDATPLELKTGYYVPTLSMVFRNTPEMLFHYKNFAKIKNGDTFLTAVLGLYGLYHYMPEVEPASYRVHEGGVWSMRQKEKKLIDSIEYYFFIAKYFGNINDSDKKIIFQKMLNRCYSMVFTQGSYNLNVKQKWIVFRVLINLHVYIYGLLRSTSFLIKIIRLLFFTKNKKH